MAFIRENKHLRVPTYTLIFHDHATGKRRGVNRSKGDFKNKSEALKEAVRLEDATKASLAPKQHSMPTLRESGISYIESKRGTVSDPWLTATSAWFGIAAGILGSDLPVDEVNVTMCVGLMQSMTTESLTKGGRVYSVESRRKFLKSMRALFDHLIQNEILSRNPWRAGAVKMPAQPQPKMVWLDTLEFNALTDSLKGSWGPWRERRLRYELQIATGGRPKEVQGIKWGDVNFERGIIRLKNVQKGSGTQFTHRTIPLPPRLRSILSAEAVGKDAGTRILSLLHNWRRDLIKDARIAGIEKKLSPYAFRHTFGTWLALRKASIYEIKNLMGHESIETTMNYIHLSEISGKEVMLDFGGSGYKLGYKSEDACAEENRDVV